MHTSYGDMEIDILRERKGEFEPKIVKKYQNTVTQDMEGEPGESLNRFQISGSGPSSDLYRECQLRKVTKSQTVLPSDESLSQMPYLARTDSTKNGEPSSGL